MWKSKQFGKTHQKAYEAAHAATEQNRHHASARVSEFGPRAFKAIRDRLVKEGRSRQFINRRMNSIRRCFRWGVAEELVPGERIQALAAVDGLRYGAAPESPPRQAADPKAVEAVIRWLEGNPVGMLPAERKTALRRSQRGFTVAATCRLCQLFLRTSVQFRTEGRGAAS